ncbi:GDSL-type esterase/lipase family protein [Pseudodesulfovibrio indicus]|uniref:GDSL-type esterase/lipase family protein n=1 Tax=Pseudodesulfovibrio indicus TaxID=1716143 RepID=UPI00292E762C|nr:GDSL-type esterase/lipase family protein [Pseudodesulfovibrio indicus]
MTLFFLGDSLTLGCGDGDGLGWPGRLASAVMASGQDLTWYNLGVRANTTAKILARWSEEVERRVLPGQEIGLVFSFGVADVANDVDFADSLANAERILTGAAAMGPTLLVGPMPVADQARTERIAALSDGYGPVCARLGVPYVPVLGALRDSRAYVDALAENDTVHPSAKGYATLAELLLKTNAVRDFLGLEP